MEELDVQAIFFNGLVGKSSAVDFVLFIFTPNNVASIRNKYGNIVRNNMVFEMRLFVGAIGKSRSFILRPHNAEMHLPTDLLGVTPTDYDASRSNNDLVFAINRACALIKSEIDCIGLINHASISLTQRVIANPA